MKCVSASRTSAETELAIFCRKTDGVIVLTLNCTRFGQYVMTLDSLGMYVVRVQQYRAGTSGTRERCVSKKVLRLCAKTPTTPKGAWLFAVCIESTCTSRKGGIESN